MIDPIIPRYEEIRNSFDVAKMLLIYEMILQAAFEKSESMVDYMTPCASPDRRKMELILAVERQTTYSAEDKEYYKKLIEFGDQAWHLYASRYKERLWDSRPQYQIKDK